MIDGCRACSNGLARHSELGSVVGPESVDSWIPRAQPRIEIDASTPQSCQSAEAFPRQWSGYSCSTRHGGGWDLRSDLGRWEAHRSPSRRTLSLSRVRCHAVTLLFSFNENIITLKHFQQCQWNGEEEARAKSQERKRNRKRVGAWSSTDGHDDPTDGLQKCPICLEAPMTVPIIIRPVLY